MKVHHPYVQIGRVLEAGKMIQPNWPCWYCGAVTEYIVYLYCNVSDEETGEYFSDVVGWFLSCRHVISAASHRMGTHDNPGFFLR